MNKREVSFEMLVQASFRPRSVLTSGNLRVASFNFTSFDEQSESVNMKHKPKDETEKFSVISSLF